MTFESRIEPSLRTQRVDARASIGLVARDGRTRLATLFQEGSAKIRLPRGDADPLQAVLINTAGGLTGGDRLRWQIDIGEKAHALVTTQACEKAYRSAGGTASVTCSIRGGAGADIAWLPQETILFEGSALERRLEAELAPNARGLFVEATIFGRTAMGESLARATFRDRWRIRRGGRLVHAEDFFAGPRIAEALGRRAAMPGAVAMATVLLVGDDAAELLQPARSLLAGMGAGVSAWHVGDTGKLLARLVAEDGYHLRKRLIPLLELLNGEAGLPKVWSI